MSDNGSNSTTLLPLQTTSLSLEYDGTRYVDAIDLSLKADKLTVVMGPNGAGKSLLLRLLHGLIAPTAGQVKWNGRLLDDATRKRQAMVFQRPILLRRSVASNIDFVLKLNGNRDRRDKILSDVGLLDFARQPARSLSVGEQQRLALARALATEPEVLFLDEPTASLDPASVLAIEQIVTRAHQNGTRIIFVTHDIGQAKRLADEVVFLHRGQLAEHTLAVQFFSAPSSPEGEAYLDGRILL
jgi:tungstate transport system ATP-binding protein